MKKKSAATKAAKRQRAYKKKLQELRTSTILIPSDIDQSSSGNITSTTAETSDLQGESNLRTACDQQMPIVEDQPPRARQPDINSGTGTCKHSKIMSVGDYEIHLEGTATPSQTQPTHIILDPSKAGTKLNQLSNTIPRQTIKNIQAHRDTLKLDKTNISTLKRTRSSCGHPSSATPYNPNQTIRSNLDTKSPPMGHAHKTKPITNLSNQHGNQGHKSASFNTSRAVAPKQTYPSRSLLKTNNNQNITDSIPQNCESGIAIADHTSIITTNQKAQKRKQRTDNPGSISACSNPNHIEGPVQKKLRTSIVLADSPLSKASPVTGNQLDNYFTFQAMLGQKRIEDETSRQEKSKTPAIDNTRRIAKHTDKNQQCKPHKKMKDHKQKHPYKRPSRNCDHQSRAIGKPDISRPKPKDACTENNFTPKAVAAIENLTRVSKAAMKLKENRILSKPRCKPRHALQPEKLKERRVKDKEHKQKSRKSKKYREREKYLAQNRKADKVKRMEKLISKFHKKTKSGPTFTCISCKRLMYKHSVNNAESLLKLNTPLTRKCLKGKEVSEGKSWVCETCKSHIKKKKVPPMSQANGCNFTKIPAWMKLNKLEWRLLAPRLVFMKMHQAPRGRQYKIEGNVVNVVANVSNTVTSLPRLPSQRLAIPIKLKRRIRYHHHAYSQNVRPNLVWKAAKWLSKNAPLYKELNMNLTPQWHKIFKKLTVFKTVHLYHKKNKNLISKDTINLIKKGEKTQKIPKHPLSKRSKLFKSSIDRFKLLRRHYNKSKGKVQKGAQNAVSNKNLNQSKYVKRRNRGKRPKGPPGSNDTMLTADGFLENHEKNRILAFAPGENQRPLSVFLDKDCEELAYPDIFLGRRRADSKHVPIKYSDIVKVELMNKDRRAAANVENLFFKSKKLQMKIITGQTSIALRKHKPNGTPIKASNFKSEDSLKSILQTDQGYQFLKTVRGSPPYFETAKKDVFAMIRQLGPATFFLSLSAAETKWTHLLKNLGRIVDKKEYTDEEIKSMKWDTTTRLIQSDPITCARHFEYQLQTFMRDFLKSKDVPLGEILDSFYRIEMQHRGSCHVHMIIWIKNAPSPARHSQKKLTKFIDKYITCELPKSQKDRELILRQRHHHSDTCTKHNTACRFHYPQPPMRRTVILEPIKKADSDYNTHYQNWVKVKVFLDSHDTNTPKTIKSMLKTLALTEEEYISAVRTSIRSNTIFLRRSLQEININNYNKHSLKAWQANMDIQFILDTYACATYVVQYITKGTRGLSHLLKEAAKDSKQSGSNIKDQMKHISNRFLNSVEISAQEAVYLALQMPLKRASRKCVFINTSPPSDRIQLLKPLNQIKQMEDDETDISSSNMIKRYTERPDALEETCLADWVAYYDESTPFRKISHKRQTDGTPPETENLNFEAGVDDNLKKDSKKYYNDKRRKKARVIRCPWFNLKDDEEKHYRELIMLFVPWRNEEEDINQNTSSFKDQYQCKADHICNLLNQYAPCRAALEEAAVAIAQAKADGELDPSNIAPLTVHMNNIDLANKHTTNDPNFVQQYDIAEDMGVHLPNLPKYEDLKHNQLKDNDFRTEVQKLNKKQREFFDYVNNTIMANAEQQLLFLSGGAGVGKSRLTKAIYQNLLRIYNFKAGDDYDSLKILVMAPTGKSAHIIQGVTIHSALHAPYNGDCKYYQALSCSLLNTLRTSLGQVEFIIIDEVSMVGNSRLHFVNERMKEIKGSEEPFGGCHVLCVGDLFQLQPVVDGWIFEGLFSKNDSLRALAPNIWEQHFKLFELTTIMRQKESKTFAELLNRLREGKQTDNDIIFIKSRVLANDFRHPTYPHFQVTHLFNTNKLVEEFNLCARVSNPVNFLANDSVSHVTNREVGLKLLQIFQGRPAKETMGLPTMLSIAINDKVEVSTNIDIADGLTNGASGVVCKLPETPAGTDTVNSSGAIWVLFDESIIGRHTRGLNNNLYEEGIDESWTPIPTVKKQMKIARNSPITATRYQFPLRVAAGKTIHRSQGQTLHSVVADFQSAQGFHKHYVALSRVTNSENLFVTNFDKNKIFTDKRVTKEMERLRSNPLILPEVLLKPKDQNITTYIFHNVRTIHKHSKDLAHDLNVAYSNILCVAETHLQPSTALKSLREIFPHAYHNSPSLQGNSPTRHGTSIFSKEELQHIQHYNTNTLEATVAYDSGSEVYLTCVYRYPTSSVPQFMADLKSIQGTRTNNKKIIMGDFNINILKKNNKTISNLCCDLKSNQLINTATTKQNTIIDHIYTNITNVKMSGVIKTYYSDHDQIFIQF